MCLPYRYSCTSLYVRYTCNTHLYVHEWIAWEHNLCHTFDVPEEVVARREESKLQDPIEDATLRRAGIHTPADQSESFTARKTRSSMSFGVCIVEGPAGSINEPCSHLYETTDVLRDSSSDRVTSVSVQRIAADAQGHESQRPIAVAIQGRMTGFWPFLEDEWEESEIVGARYGTDNLWISAWQLRARLRATAGTWPSILITSFVLY